MLLRAVSGCRACGVWPRADLPDLGWLPRPPWRDLWVLLREQSAVVGGSAAAPPPEALKWAMRRNGSHSTRGMQRVAKQDTYSDDEDDYDVRAAACAATLCARTLLQRPEARLQRG